jgi:membrane-bound lytic murein transglycosylase B
MHRPPPPSMTTTIRRLRAAGAWLFVMLVAAAVLPGLDPGASGRAGGGLLLAQLGVNQVPSSDEWARLRREAWLQGREAAAEAARERPPAAAAARGLGAAAPVPAAFPVGADNAIPALALRAYREAAAWASGFDPGCGLSWTVLAGIGRIESDHGMHFGAATRFSPNGVVSPVITGPPLNGLGVARIPDTDGGRWDQDTTWDRAVGPMQFIPSTWRSLGRDGNGDGIADPNNLFDATVSAAAYLCLNGGDLRDPAQLRRAIFGYNHSWGYVAAVLRWAALYGSGVSVGPIVTGGAAPPSPPALAAPATTRRVVASAAEPPASRLTTTTAGATTTGTTTSSGTTTTTGGTTTTGTSTTSTTTARPPTTSGTTTSTSAPTTTAPCAPATTDPGSTTTSTTTTTLPDPTTTTLPPCK